MAALIAVSGAFAQNLNKAEQKNLQKFLEQTSGKGVSNGVALKAPTVESLLASKDVVVENGSLRF